MGAEDFDEAIDLGGIGSGGDQRWRVAEKFGRSEPSTKISGFSTVEEIAESRMKAAARLGGSVEEEDAGALLPGPAAEKDAGGGEVFGIGRVGRCRRADRR